MLEQSAVLAKFSVDKLSTLNSKTKRLFAEREREREETRGANAPSFGKGRKQGGGARLVKQHSDCSPEKQLVPMRASTLGKGTFRHLY